MDPISSRTIQGVMAQLQARSPKAAAPVAEGADFGSAFKGALDKVSARQSTADQLQRRFQLGDPQVSLEETMLASQSASLSFQALVQVRNRVVSAYQDIMNMQI